MIYKYFYIDVIRHFEESRVTCSTKSRMKYVFTRTVIVCNRSFDRNAILLMSWRDEKTEITGLPDFRIVRG